MEIFSRRTIALKDIIIPPNRQRREFDQSYINELAESIASPGGLIHAPILRMEFDLEKRGETQYFLVAGECRLRAILQIFDLGGEFTHDGELFVASRGEVPFTLKSDLTPLQIREVEYDENTKRRDLTWQERAAATAELAAIRAEQAKLAGEAPPTTSDIALEVRGAGANRGGKFDVTRKEIVIAAHLDDPEVRSAADVHEAFKVVKRQEETRKNIAKAEVVGRTYSADRLTALCDDALDWLTKCPAEQFDVILTDPPYGMGADEFADSGGAGGSRGGHSYEDSEDYFMTVLSYCADYFKVITKSQAHLYWFCDFDNFHVSKERFELAGWWVHRTPIIWHKPTASRIPWPDHGPQRKYELILYAVKGKRPITKIGLPDLVSYPPDPQLDHAAQKPVDLYVDLLRRSVRPGDSVLDCFSGTGTIFPAAHALKCAATGVEKDPESYAKGVQRIEKLKAQGELKI